VPDQSISSSLLNQREGEWGKTESTEAEFLDVIGTEVLRVFLLATTNTDFIPQSSPLEQKWFETGF
jgi:hypothetical protein